MKVIVPLADGFEEIEFTTIVDILRRGGIDVIVAGLKGGEIEGAHKIKIIPDTLIDKIDAEDFDGVILPGGYPGFVKLGEDERVLELIKKLYSRDKYVGAICGAPSVLDKAGILQGKKATIHPGVREQLKNAQYVDERVVVDGKIITSQAPGTAMEFSLKLVDILAGCEKMEKIKSDTRAEII